MSIWTNYCQVHEAEMAGTKIPPGQLCLTCGAEHCGVWAECLRNYWAIHEAIELGHPKPEGVKEETWLMHSNKAKVGPK